MGHFFPLFSHLSPVQWIVKKKKRKKEKCPPSFSGEPDRVAVWNKGDASFSIALHQHYLPDLPVALYSTSPCQVGNWHPTRG